MPIYEYRCTCGMTRDVMCKWIDAKDALDTPCPVCEGVFERVVLNTPAVQFKGGGWPGQDIKLQETKQRAGDLTQPCPAHLDTSLLHH